MDYKKASDQLSQMELVIRTDHLLVEVIWCRVMSVEGDWLIQNHKHYSYEFHFCAKGSSLVKLDEEEILLEQGQMLITGPGVYHEQGPGPDDHYTEYALNCNITLLDQEDSESAFLFRGLQESGTKLYPCHDLLVLFEEVLAEAQSKHLGYYNKILCLLNMILIESSRLMMDQSVEYAVPKSMTVHDPRYHEIYRLIKTHLDEPYSLQEIADKMHLSQRQLNRLVQANTKMTLKQLMSEMRFNRLKDYLLDTDWSLQEISDRMHFSSVYYLNAFFKRYEHIAPSVYRRMSKKHK